MTDIGWRHDPEVRGWTLGEWAGDQLAGAAYATLDVASLAAAAPRSRRLIAENATGKAGGIPLPAAAFDGPPDAPTSYTCGHCWHVSFSPDRIADRTCPDCGRVNGDDDE